MKDFNYVDTDAMHIKLHSAALYPETLIEKEEDPYVRDMKREGTSAYAYFTKKED